MGRAGRIPWHTWAAKRTAETAAELTWVIDYNENGDDYDDLAREKEEAGRGEKNKIKEIYRKRGKRKRERKGKKKKRKEGKNGKRKKSKCLDTKKTKKKRDGQK